LVAATPSGLRLGSGFEHAVRHSESLHTERDAAATYRSEPSLSLEETAMSSLWTVEEVAEFLNVRPLRIYELVYAREIPFTKIGRRQLRFDPAAIRQWLDARTTQAQVQANQER